MIRPICNNGHLRTKNNTILGIRNGKTTVSDCIDCREIRESIKRKTRRRCKTCGKLVIARWAEFCSFDCRPKGVLKHGASALPEYNSWQSMKGRCLNKNNDDYLHYGGRGIKVCKRWISSFENFYHDMGLRPSRKHSIDRIDNDGNYEPKNCRWSTQDEQTRNRRRMKNKFNIPYRGVYPKFKNGIFRGIYEARDSDNKIVYLGAHKSAVLAALAFDEYQVKMGRLFRLNFPSLWVKST